MLSLSITGIGLFEWPAQWPIKTDIVTTWIQTHKSVPIYMGAWGATHYTVEVVYALMTSDGLNVRTSRGVVLNVLPRSHLCIGTLTSRSPLSLGIRLIYNPVKWHCQFLLVISYVNSSSNESTNLTHTQQATWTAAPATYHAVASNRVLGRNQICTAALHNNNNTTLYYYHC